MADMVRIRRWQEFWDEYIYEGQKQGLKNNEIKRNLIEAFRKEIFDTIMFRGKVEDIEALEHTKKNEDLVQNVFRQALKKWRRLVAETKKYLATAMLINDDDLTLWDEEEIEDGGYEFCEAGDPEELPEGFEEVEDPDEDYESPWDGDEATAEWPELSEVDGYSAEAPVTSGYMQIDEPTLPEVGQEFPAGYWTRH